MNYIIYKTTNKINNKYYIGKHKTRKIDDGYLGSGSDLKKDINLYGLDNFTKEILLECKDMKEMNQKEQEIVNEYIVKDTNSYNLKTGGEGGWDYINKFVIDHRRKNVKKMQDVLKEKLMNDDFRMIWSKRSSNILKRTHAEGKIKYDTFTGKHHTEETKKKQSKSKIGKYDGKNNPMYGKHHTEDSKRKISETLRNKY